MQDVFSFFTKKELCFLVIFCPFPDIA